MGNTQTGQPGPCTSSIEKQHAFQAIAEDRMRMAAAHPSMSLERPRLCRLDLVGQRFDFADQRPPPPSRAFFFLSRSAEFVGEFHCMASC